jgi:hypothetical protein
MECSVCLPFNRRFVLLNDNHWIVLLSNNHQVVSLLDNHQPSIVVPYRMTTISYADKYQALLFFGIKPKVALQT